MISGIFIVCISILLLTSFVKVITCMSILRYGLGLYGAGFGFVFFALSLATSLYVASPYINGIDDIASFSSYKEVQKKFKPFLEKNIADDIKTKFKISDEKLLVQKEENNKLNTNEQANEKVIEETKDEMSLHQISFLFMISQVRDALKYGLMILIPFLIIDLLIMNIFLSLGIKDFPYLIASLPVKLGVFVSVDGIVIIFEKLISFYN